MAKNGYEMKTILQFSRHADVDMLMRYLNWGQVIAAHREEMIDVIDRSLNAISMTTSTTSTSHL